MKKKLMQLAALAVLSAASLAPAQARLFPGTGYGSCTEGYYEVVHYGWFGSVSSVDYVAC